MTYLGSMLSIVDNSGGKYGLCIGRLGKSNRLQHSSLKLGEIILVSLRNFKAGKKFVKGLKLRALVVRNKKKIKRLSGLIIWMEKTGIILLKKGDIPIAKRIYGPILYELRRFSKIKLLSLAPLLI